MYKVMDKLGSLFVLAVLGAILALMAAPIVSDFLAGLGTVANGSGPLSGAMVYALMAPVSLMLYTSVVSRLIGIAIATVTGLCVRLLTTLFETGEYGFGFLALFSIIAVYSAAYRFHKKRERKRAEGVEALAKAVATVVDQTTKQLKERYSQSIYKPSQSNAPIHALSLAENLALGATWQATAFKDTDTAASQILQGLYDIRTDLAENNVTDPNNYGAATIDLYMVNVKKFFETNGIKGRYRAIANGPSHGEFRAIRQMAPPAGGTQPSPQESSSGAA